MKTTADDLKKWRTDAEWLENRRRRRTARQRESPHTDDAAGAARDWQRRALKNATGNRDRLELDCSVYQEPRPCNCDWEQNEQCEECRWSVVDDPRKPEAGQ